MKLTVESIFCYLFFFNLHLICPILPASKEYFKAYPASMRLAAIYLRSCRHTDKLTTTDRHIDTQTSTDRHIDTQTTTDGHIDTQTSIDRHIDTQTSVDMSLIFLICNDCVFDNNLAAFCILHQFVFMTYIFILFFGSKISP